MAKQPKKSAKAVEAVEATAPVRPAHVVTVKGGTGASKTRAVAVKTVTPKGVKTR